MTLPFERYNSLYETRKFLVDLIHPSKTPRVPKSIRQQAKNVLRHFPTYLDLEQISEKAPEIIKKDFKKHEYD